MAAIPQYQDTGETRERILGAAERLFAARGYDGTSVRDITVAADVNIASVSYYFGGKDGLYREVFERILVELREIRILRLRTDLDDAGADASLERFLESFAHAFIDPLVEGTRSKGFIAIFDQEMRDPRVPKEMFVRQLVRPMLDTTNESLKRVGIDLDPATCGMCMMSMVGQLLHVLKIRERFLSADYATPFPEGLEDHIQHFVKFSAAGIRACHGDQKSHR